MKKIDYKAQGKRNRASGLRFEKKVREVLESYGWIVSKWQNNVEFTARIISLLDTKEKREFEEKIFPPLGKCIPAKMGRFRTNQNGFPDFFVYRIRNRILINIPLKDIRPENEIIFVECKCNGRLSKDEKQKAQWYLKHNYCSRFFVAFRTKIKNRIIVNYKEFKQDNTEKRIKTAKKALVEIRNNPKLIKKMNKTLK